jgi:hypothetical protein
MTAVNGSTPLSFTGTTGAQRYVPLSALQFNGSTLEITSAWAGEFDTAETETLMTLAQQLVARKELIPQPVASPAPALLLTAARIGPETNGIVVTATPATGQPPLDTTIGIRAVETDTWSSLTSATNAAATIGTDTPPANQGDPPEGTGIVVVQAAGVNPGKGMPVAVFGTLDQSGNKTLAVKDASNSVLFTIAPCAGYDGKKMTVTVTPNATNTSFSVEAVYDSRAELGGSDPTVTVRALDTLPAEVTFLVTASAPASGAAVPAASSVPLAGGNAHAAASGILYTS